MGRACGIFSIKMRVIAALEFCNGFIAGGDAAGEPVDDRPGKAQKVRRIVELLSEMLMQARRPLRLAALDTSPVNGGGTNCTVA